MRTAAVTGEGARTLNAADRVRLVKAQVEALELRQTVERLDQVNRELLAERASLVRDLTEWQRIAAERAGRIVALEHRLGA